MNPEDFESQFQYLWEKLKIENHIVQALRKKKNVKQAVEDAATFHRDVKSDVLEDLRHWYHLKKHLGEQIDEQIVRDDILHRINGELSKISVPLLDTVLFR